MHTWWPVIWVKINSHHCNEMLFSQNPMFQPLMESVTKKMTIVALGRFQGFCHIRISMGESLIMSLLQPCNDLQVDEYSSSYRDVSCVFRCIEYCAEQGFTYAGVQHSDYCFCGNERPSDDFLAPDSECNHKCDGDRGLICGGFCRMNVYTT